MTPRIKPIISVSVTKKPDGRMVLSYGRTATPTSTQKRDGESSTVILERSATLTDTDPTTRDGPTEPDVEAIPVDSLDRPT